MERINATMLNLRAEALSKLMGCEVVIQRGSAVRGIRWRAFAGREGFNLFASSTSAAGLYDQLHAAREALEYVQRKAAQRANRGEVTR